MIENPSLTNICYQEQVHIINTVLKKVTDVAYST